MHHITKTRPFIRFFPKTDKLNWIPIDFVETVFGNVLGITESNGLQRVGLSCRLLGQTKTINKSF